MEYHITIIEFMGGSITDDNNKNTKNNKKYCKGGNYR